MMTPEDLPKLKTDIRFEEILRDRRLRFHSTWGLFNPTSIDEGTRLLLDQMEVGDAKHILDLGCGYGAIGLTLGATLPQAQVHLVDKDFVAVEYANKNAAANNLPNCKAYLSNGFSHVPKDIKFDIIVSNLPAKVGKEMLYIILNDAKAFLKPGGTIYVVTISGLKEYIKRQFKEIFGNFKKVKQSKTYVVSMAQKAD
jgi:16S rRNA G1207 methylase RsmC